MPLQNRVTPFGEIVADPARGLLMGNRGILHDDARQLGTARWRHPHWVICEPSFGGRKRTPMTSGQYTELFFLDEATALAAGHRPCAQCRRKAHRRFVEAWCAAHGIEAPPDASAIDAALHRARVTRTRLQVTFETEARGLPDGAMIALDGAAWLVRHGSLMRWSAAGYAVRRSLPERVVTVLTPRPTVRTLEAGYVPLVHPTADPD